MSTSRTLRQLPKTCAVVTKSCPTRQVSPCISSAFAAPVPSRASHCVSRRFQSTRSHAQAPTPAKTIQDEVSGEENVDLVLEDEMLAIQNAAIADLESRLGKSLEKAVAEDNLAEQLLGGSQTETDDIHTSEEILSPRAIAEHRLIQLRVGGSSSEVVAREARNIFRDYLPAEILSDQELAVYKRLYGEPLPEPEEAEEDYLDNETEIVQLPENVLLNAEGEQIPYLLEKEQDIADGKRGRVAQREENSAEVVPHRYKPMDLDQAGQMEEIAKVVGGNLIDEDEQDFERDEEDTEADDTRSHPLTSLGRFATYPRTTFFSRETFVQPVEQVMSNFSNKQLKDVCERTFGGPGLPDSPLTPQSGRSRQQIPIPLEAGQNTMSQMEANAFMTSVMPPTYASISAIMVETRKRLGSSWLNKLLARPGGPRVLDAGSGGVGILAWRDIIAAHWDSLHSSDKNPPQAPDSKTVVLTGSDTLRHRAAAMLENTTFVPRLPDYVNTRGRPTLDDDRPAQQKKQFDVIVASHSLFPLKEEWERKQHVQNLWSLLSDDGGVLIMVEKGIPRGFETIAAARDMLLERYIAIPEGLTTHYSTVAESESPDSEMYQKSPGMIVAPCTNHDRCPLYRTSGISKGRKDICSFQQRYVRPPFLQRVLGAKDRNHDDVDFSYISVMKGDDLRNRSFSTFDHVSDPISAPKAPKSKVASIAKLQEKQASQIQQGFEHIDPTWSDSPAPPPTHNYPRILNTPLKRRGHITLDLCTPQAEIRRWTVPKSFSRQAYRDARKARWGDLWALGAKTSIPRNLRLGTPEKELARGEGLAGTLGKARGRKERLKMQAEQVLDAEETVKDQEEAEEEEFMKMLEEDNLLDEDDDDLIDMDDLVPKKKGSKKTVHGHAKIDGINVFGKQAPAKPMSATTTSRAEAIERPSTQRHSHPKMTQEKFNQVLGREDYTPGRIGDEDNLSAWSEEFNSAMLEDEARAHAQKNGRRATTKNTQRLKRDLRRVRRENGV